MVARYLSLLCAFLGLFAAVVSAATCPRTADYTISFYSDWSNTTLPNAFPANAHFSPLIGCSHGSDYSIFSTSIKATTGVKQVAETGGKTDLAAEINNQIALKKAWRLFQASSTLGPTATTPNIALQVTPDFPRVSAISMIAPSPDWFVGIKNVDLCGDDGQWKESYDMTNLQPWDAGTDNGTEFTSGNSANMPAVNIFQITSVDMDTSFRVFASNNIPSLGRIMLKRTNTPTRTSCSGEETYQLNFQGMWSASNHPAGFPSNAHFSQLIGATHNSTYKMWSPGTRVSPGVEIVAETGAPGTLKVELSQAKMSGYIHGVFESDSTIDSDGRAIANVKVTDGFSRVSIITMLAPSPDWFVGLDSFDLCGSDGEWKTGGEFSLPAWDAGTEDGTTFSLANNPTNPVDVVRLITKDSDTVMKGADAIPPFAKVTFEKGSAHCPSGELLMFVSIVFVAVCRAIC